MNAKLAVIGECHEGDHAVSDRHTDGHLLFCSPGDTVAISGALFHLREVHCRHGSAGITGLKLAAAVLFPKSLEIIDGHRNAPCLVGECTKGNRRPANRLRPVYKGDFPMFALGVRKPVPRI